MSAAAIEMVLSELTGATRQWLVVIAYLYGAFYIKRKDDVGSCILMVSIAGGAGLLSYMVREPCRPKYEIGCGVNGMNDVGVLLGLVVLVVAAAMIFYYELPQGWVVAAAAVYNIDYFLSLYHWGWESELIGVVISVGLLIPWADYYRRKCFVRR